MTSDVRATQPDHGFTLVELLVVVILIGILVTAVAAAFIAFVRTDDSVVQRLTNSNDLQNLESFLPGDVASASTIENGSVDAPFGPLPITDANCMGLSTNPVLRLGWDQRWRDGSVTEYEVVYDFVSAGRLVRRSCVGNTSTAHTVARHFIGAPVVAVPLAAAPPSPPPLLGTVEIVLAYGDDNRRLAASSRNYLTP